MSVAVEGLLGRKVGMTQVFREDGTAVPVTVLKAGPCVIVGSRTKEKDGYEAVRIGLVERFSKSKLNKPMRGTFEKHSLAPLKTLREFKYTSSPEGEESEAKGPKAGDRVLVDMFESGGRVDIAGISKGKGFAGVIKRHHFGGGRASHGSMFHRAPGSIGQSAYPSRVFQGTRMPGQMGNKRATIKNIEVVRIYVENNLLMVKGAVPGARGTLLEIRKTRGS
jgi:large subunit ribosomal protein L3